MKTVLGLDLSLTSTGLAGNAGGGWTATLKPPPKLRGHERLAHIHAVLVDRYLDGIDLVAVEGPSYGSQAGQQGHHERAGLWWLITHSLWKTHVPLVVVPPTCVKKWLTGRGNAAKDDIVREVTRRFVWFDGDNNQADALGLASMGAHHIGHPMVEMPVLHLRGLVGVDWTGAPE